MRTVALPGRTVLRKAFVHVDTPNVDVLKDAIGVILRQPEDSKISMVMMGLGSYSDTRAEARDRIESYITKGVESRYLLLGNHFVGQQSLQEAPPILTGNRDERSAGEGGDGGICRHGSAVKGSAGGAPAAGAL